MHISYEALHHIWQTIANAPDCGPNFQDFGTPLFQATGQSPNWQSVLAGICDRYPEAYRSGGADFWTERRRGWTSPLSPPGESWGVREIPRLISGSDLCDFMAPRVQLHVTRHLSATTRLTALAHLWNLDAIFITVLSTF